MHASAELSLAALQERMAAALLAADAAAQDLPEQLFAGAHPGATGMRVHRNTVLGALCNALRASFTSIERLVGEAFFDRMAVEYARAAPPRAPQLNLYGSDFPDFIADFPGTGNLPYLAELARFDWQLDALGRMQSGDESAGTALLLDGGVRLRFRTTLRVHAAAYAVEELRNAILADDAQALGAIDLKSAAHHYALWRAPAGVKVQRLSAVSARFLAAALAGADGVQALAAAAADQGAADQDAVEVAAILAGEILPAGFVRIIKEAP